MTIMPHWFMQWFGARLTARSHFYQHGLTLIPTWISNCTHYNVWGGITYPFPNFNGATVEFWV